MNNEGAGLAAGVVVRHHARRRRPARLAPGVGWPGGQGKQGLEALTRSRTGGVGVPFATETVTFLT